MAAAMASPRSRKLSQGKQRIQIRFIANKNSRQVTFSKRRKGLFKKASELSQLCGARVTVVVFSENSKPFAFGAPSVDDVLRAYAPLPAEDEDAALASCLAWLLDEDDAAGRGGVEAAAEAALQQAEETAALVAAEQARMDAVGKKVMQAKADGRSWWEADVEQLGEAELPEFARALRRLRDNVQRHADQLSSAAAQPPPPMPPKCRRIKPSYFFRF